jgi:hypothetical protein
VGLLRKRRGGAMAPAVIFAEMVTREVSIPYPDGLVAAAVGLLCVNTVLLLVAIALLLVLLLRKR